MLPAAHVRVFTKTKKNTDWDTYNFLWDVVCTRLIIALSIRSPTRDDLVCTTVARHALFSCLHPFKILPLTLALHNRVLHTGVF